MYISAVCDKESLLQGVIDYIVCFSLTQNNGFMELKHFLWLNVCVAKGKEKKWLQNKNYEKMDKEKNREC